MLLTTALIDGEDGVHFFTQLQDLRDRHRADRFSQAVAEVSRVALEVPDVTALMRQVVEIVQEAAGGDPCGVVMTHGSDGPLRVVARDSGITGEEPTLPRGTGSQAGYTLAVDDDRRVERPRARAPLHHRPGSAGARPAPRAERAGALDPQRRRRRRARRCTGPRCARRSGPRT